MLVANYLGGNVAVLPVTKGGVFAEATDVEQHSGSGPNRERQEAPHAHSVLLDASNRHAYACDLGTDKVMVYDFDPRRGTLTPTRNLLRQPQARRGAEASDLSTARADTSTS